MKHDEKTVLQMAQELGVSKQALVKRLGREPLKTVVSGYTYIENGTKVLKIEAQSLIKAAYGTDQVQMSIDGGSDVPRYMSPGTSIDVTMYTFLKMEMEKKDTELAAKNAQIEAIQAESDAKSRQIDKLIEMNEHNQELQLRLTKQLEQLQLPPPKKRWPWSK